MVEAPDDAEMDMTLRKLHMENAELKSDIRNVQVKVQDLQERAEACYYLPEKPGYMQAKQQFHALCE